MSEVEVIGDFSVEDEPIKSGPNIKPQEEEKTKKNTNSWKKKLIGLTAGFIGIGATVGAIYQHIEEVRHEENYDAKKVEKVIAPNGLKLRYNKPNEENINDENEDDYKILQPETPIYVLYGDEVKVHNNIKCLTTTFIRAGIRGEYGEMIIGWAAEKEVLDNSDLFDEPETFITDFITDVDKIRTARVINKTDIHTGDPVNIAWKTPVYDLGNNKVAFIGEDGNVSVIEVEEGDLEGDLSMSKNNASEFRTGMRPKNDEGNNKGNINSGNITTKVRMGVAEQKNLKRKQRTQTPCRNILSRKGINI